MLGQINLDRDICSFILLVEWVNAEKFCFSISPGIWTNEGGVVDPPCEEDMKL